MTHLHAKPTKLNINWKLIIAVLMILSMITLNAHEIETVTIYLDLTSMVPDNFTEAQTLTYCEYLDGIYSPEYDECKVEILVSN